MSTPDTHHLSHSLQQPNANLADQLFPPSPPRQHPAAPLPKIKLSVAKWLTKNPDHSSTASSNGGYDDDDAPDERAMNRSRSRSSRAPAAASSKKRSTRGNSAVSYQETDEYESSGGGGGRATRGRSTRNGDASMDSTLDANGTYEEDGEDQVEEVVHINGVAGSEQDGEGEMDEDAVVVEDDDEDDEDDQPVVRRRAKVIKQLSDSEEPELVAREPQLITTTSAHGRRTTRPAQYGGSTDDDDFQEDKPKRGGLRRGGSSRRNNDDFVDADEEYDREDDGYGVKRSGRVRQKRQQEDQRKQNLRLSRRQQAVLAKKSESTRSTRNSAKADLSFDNEGEGEAEESTDSDGSDDLLLDDEDDEDGQGAPRNLRQKPKVDYYSMAPLEAPRDKGKGKAKGKQRSAGYGGDPFSGLPVNMTAEMWQTLYPEKNGGQSSDSDDDAPGFSTPRKAALFGSTAAAAAAGFPGASNDMFAGSAGADMAVAGTPSNLGKVGNANADTDPLGIESTVSFDSVGGLGNHIQQLKEMVSLPLLYPEVFERFNITPPRGVLFHGPPGTGKTLLARALAASCSTDGRKISFFMRKGADCLSKWVGEAERQLRLLFDEAKACQPSIIFFDEIDGLAPVRSSKQDQVHASIVSTLLALMDGMDGRGQVIVIGATNRPDAIDPALRRPGRFDREFYFPLPNLEGRRKILDIHTSGWVPPIEESFKDELAHLTKGYGGADLRALCTEAALNAVQRTYPQIYKTNERLVIDPQTIDVTARDFIVSQKNLIPSTARATSSSAAPLPPQLVPLLADAFEAAKVALAKVLPDVKRPNVLEEAEWEDDGGGFEKEKMMQAFETLRVFRPRMLVCGESGMGQSYVGAAVLHHLEGFHVQNLDLATLVADSSRTMEAACVQLFVEAKRHKPSILFIPSLITWCSTVTETVKSTIKGLLEGLDPSDPILLLAVVDGPLSELPGDVRSWFGFVKANRVVMTQPGPEQRAAFFAEVLAGIQRPPNEFPDAMPKRRRVLAELPIAPPPPPKVATPAEIAALEQKDQRDLEYLKWRLGPVLNELKKRYKRFCRDLYDDWRSDDLEWRKHQQATNEPVVGLGDQPYHNVDLDSMHVDLYKGYFLTPDDFLADVLRIQVNAEVNALLEQDSEAPIKAGQMVNHSVVMIDQLFDQGSRVEYAKMAVRIKEREKLNPTAHSKKRKGRKEVVAGAHAIAAIAAAGGYGGGYGGFGGAFNVRQRPQDTNGVIVLDDDGEVAPGAKRSRVEDGEDAEMGEGGNEARPAKKSKGLEGSDADADAAGEEDDSLPVASTSRLDNIMNAEDTSSSVVDTAAGSLFSATNLINPYAIPPTATSRLAHLSVVTPLSSPDDTPTSTQPLDTATNAVASTSGVRFAEQVEVEEPTSPTLVPTTPERVEAVVAIASPIAVDPPTPEPLPTFFLDETTLSSISTFLTEETGELSIDELEQLRASCYDIIWRGRKDWDRQAMMVELEEVVREFVEEVNECH